MQNGKNTVLKLRPGLNYELFKLGHLANDDFGFIKTWQGLASLSRVANISASSSSL